MTVTATAPALVEVGTCVGCSAPLHIGEWWHDVRRLHPRRRGHGYACTSCGPEGELWRPWACELCGAGMAYDDRADRRYCSNRCRQKAYRQRHPA